jgi:hypothetical protein
MVSLVYLFFYKYFLIFIIIIFYKKKDEKNIMFVPYWSLLGKD